MTWMPVSEPHRLFEAAREGKALRIFQGQAHLEMISPDNPASQGFMRDTADWLWRAVAHEAV
jgi:hypothetical protein